MRIGEVMTKDVVTAARDASLGSVAELMRDRNVGSVVICEEGRPYALITDRDVALAVADGFARDDEAAARITRPLVTGDPEMEVEEAAGVMVQYGIRRLPVLAGGEL